MTVPSRRLEPVVQRVRARTGERIILDTTHAQLLFEDERHPWRAIPKDALLAPLAGPAVGDNLDGRWRAIDFDGTRHARAVRTWDTPPADCPALAGVAAVHHDLADQRLEEEHPVCGMPKKPYHRVDALGSGRHIQILVDGEPLATTHRPALIIDTGVPRRWQIPPRALPHLAAPWTVRYSSRLAWANAGPAENRARARHARIHHCSCGSRHRGSTSALAYSP